MKVRYILLFLLIYFSMNTSAQVNYAQQWKQIETAHHKRQPATVIKLTDQLIAQSERGKNYGQLMKALTWRVEHRKQIDDARLFPDLQDLEKRLIKATSPVYRALLRTYLVSEYALIMRNNAWQWGDQRAVAFTEVPANMDEWTYATYWHVIRTHLSEVRKDASVLKNTKNKTLAPYVEQGLWSKYYDDDLLHVVLFLHLEALDRIYQLKEELRPEVEAEIKACRELLQQAYADNASATLLNNIRWWRSSYAQQQDKEERAQQLEVWYRQNRENPLVVEVIYELMGWYWQENGELDVMTALYEEAVNRFPQYERINIIKEFYDGQVLAPSLTMELPREAYEGEVINVRIKHRMARECTFVWKKNGEEVHRYTLSLGYHTGREPVGKYIGLKAPSVGLYELTVLVDGAKSDAFYHSSGQKIRVTNLSILSYQIPQRYYTRFKAIVLDRRTGHPIQGAEVASVEDGVIKEKKKTAADGSVFLSSNPRYSIELWASHAGDTTQTGGQHYWSECYGDRYEPAQYVVTDRSIYRPGQKVYFKGLYKLGALAEKVAVAGKTLKVFLWDSNGKALDSLQVKVNDMGSYSGEFTLPTSVLNGTFNIGEDAWGGYSFQGESYKRPTFEILLQQPQKPYRMGDSLHLEGEVKRYDSAPLSHQSVNYKVYARRMYSYKHRAGNNLIAEGTVTADAQGKFSIPVWLKGNDESSLIFTVEATVTSAAGETQTNSQNILAGNKLINLAITAPKVILKENTAEITFLTHLFSGETYATEGSYSIHFLPNRSRRLDKRNKIEIPTTQLESWGEKAPVLSGAFTSNEPTNIDWKQLKSGNYLLKATVKDKYGNTETAYKEITLFSRKDKQMPFRTPLFLYSEKKTISPQDPASIYIGTTEKDAYLIVYITSDTEVIREEGLRPDSTLQHIVLPYKEDYGSGITVQVCMLKNGEYYWDEINLESAVTSPKIMMQWEVFRDKLLPGQQEEWRLTVKKADGTPATAEVLALMYDASLDRFAPHHIALYTPYIIPRQIMSWTLPQIEEQYYWFYKERKNATFSDLRFSRFRTLFTEYYETFSSEDVSPVSTVREGVTLYYAAAASPLSARLAKNEDLLTENAVGAPPAMGKENTSTDSNMRSDFSETAFFYPHLRTNERGEVQIAFTLPHSLTRWNVKAFAHTPELHTGTLEATVVATKDFTLSINSPRFVRVGDRCQITSLISNTTAQEQKGKVSFKIYSANTEKVIAEEVRDFTIHAHATDAVTFSLNVTDAHEVLVCEMRAYNKQFSDGERRLIPVIPNVAPLTATKSIILRGAQREFQARLSDLFSVKALETPNRQLTVEFTSNPAWYAIQALPTLTQPTFSNAVSWVNKLYAEEVAKHILRDAPRLKKVLATWEAEGKTAENLTSQLEKNAELKSVLLAETPWVLDAENESAQQQRLSALFDLNKIRKESEEAFKHLRELQREDGGISWFDGMPSSPYISLYVATLQARLGSLVGNEPTLTAWVPYQQKVVHYLHTVQQRYYDKWLAGKADAMKLYRLSDFDIAYLYLISISRAEVPATYRTAFDFYAGKLPHVLQSSSMKNKAMAYVALREKQPELAADFIRSLKEHLSQDADQGMYFAFNESPYTWGNWAVSAHTAVMEALRMAGEWQVLEEMGVWLLQQKQRKAWSSPVVTVDAVHALLSSNAQLLSSNEPVEVLVNKRPLAVPSDALPMLGYQKQSYGASDFTAKTPIRISKTSDAVSWGAVYLQYQQALEEVEASGKELQIEKKLYVQRSKNGAPVLIPIEEAETLSVGEVIVSRLLIRIDRSMDFIHVKDQHGACMEPQSTHSGYTWSNGIGFYRDVKDASTNYFFDSLASGTYVLESSFYLDRKGTYQAGLATIQSAYAPQFSAHSRAVSIHVE